MWLSACAFVYARTFRTVAALWWIQVFILYVLSSPRALLKSSPGSQLCHFFEKAYLTLTISTSFQITLCLWHMHPERCQLGCWEIESCVLGPSAGSIVTGFCFLDLAAVASCKRTWSWHNPASAAMPLSPDCFMCNGERFRSYKATFSHLVIAVRGPTLLPSISKVLLALGGKGNGICRFKGRIRS